MGKRFLLSISSGLILGISWVEITGLFPLVFVALVPFLILEDEIYRTKSKASEVYLHALIIFVLFNVITTWWIYYSTAVGAFLAFFFSAVFVAFPFLCFHLTKRIIGKKEGYIAFVINILAFEWIDYNWPLSHPWLPFGNAFAGAPNLVQWYEFTGVSGGSLWVLLINLLVFFGWKKHQKTKSFSKLKKHFIAIGLLIIIPISLSYLILAGVDTGVNNKTIGIVLSQPNVDPYKKFDGSTTSLDQTKNLLKVAEKSITQNTQLIIAPETALPNSLEEGMINYSEEVQVSRVFLKNYPNAALLTGASTHAIFEQENSPASRKLKGGGGYWEAYNSTLVIDQSDSVEIYHKSKLVLGVETLPFQFITKPLEAYFDLGGTSGTLGVEKNAKNFKRGDAIIAPTICYESIYGEYMAQFCKNGANLISVSTNDAWWHNTPGYKQLLAYTQLRAIENRKWIARSANTGISCFINPKGEIVKKTKWEEATSLAMEVPLMNATTFYTRNGDVIYRVTLLVAPLLLLLTFVRRFKRQ